MSHRKNKKTPKHKFVPNIWITFMFNGMECIGRTLVNSQKQEVVSIICDDGSLGQMPFELIELPIKLTLREKERPVDINVQMMSFVNAEA